MSALDIFSEKMRAWFLAAVGTPTPVQEEGWPVIASGKDVLVSAPTGTGKTLTAFLYWIDLLSREENRDGVQVVYISPLKALGNDIRENLKRPIEGLGVNGLVRTAVRTGDTPPADRTRMRKHPPQILITTPESLYLLITSKSGREMLKSAKCVICDELHAVLDSKRGTHLAVSLARLDALCGRRLQRIGLSATVRPPEAAADFLSGPERKRATIVAPRSEKALDIRVDLPVKDIRILPEKSVWPAIADRAYTLSREARTTLAFVDGRAQAEKLAFQVNQIAGGSLPAADDKKAAPYARTHHGCVSKEQRLEAETQLREGKLRLLCCTSSMELGIDVGDIDLVLQIGAPGSISSLLQRAGRAGHGPGRVSHMRVYPKTEGDALGCALVAKGALEGELEKPRIPEMCLDVLAQHLVSMAAASEYEVDEAVSLLRTTWPYRDLTKPAVEAVLRMLAGDFEHEIEKPVRPRVLYNRLAGTVSGDSYTRMLACSSGGTIPDRGWYAVTLADGTRLGELDEEYVFEARLGDRFLLGAFAWRIQEIGRDRVIVAPSTSEGAQSPFWRGDGAGRSAETGEYYGGLLRSLQDASNRDALGEALSKYPLSEEAAQAAARHIERQIEADGALADDRTIVMEHFQDDAGEHQLMIHCIYGRRVNRALSMLLREEAKRQTGLDVRAYEDDDGILLYLIGGSEVPDGLIESLDPSRAEAVVRATLPGEPLFSMSYRYAAGRALMLGMRKGSRQPLWVQRLRGAESLSAAIAKGGHPLLIEAERECVNDMLDVPALVKLLSGVRSGKIRVRELHSDIPSPMALPLRRQVEAEMMYEYNPIPSSATRMAQDQADRARMVSPEPETIGMAYEADAPRSREETHSRLLSEGDLSSDEPGAMGEWLEELAREGRAEYIEPGLWIAEEEKELYALALEKRDPEAISRLIRRAMRFRGPQDEKTLSERYCLEEETFRQALEELEREGIAVRADGLWVHKDIYEGAQRRTVRLRRERVKIAPPERFAALLARGTSFSGPPAEQLSKALSSLSALETPAQAWEDSLLPARVSGYRPKLLDDLLAGGEYGWLIRQREGKPYLRFLRPEDEGDAFVAPDMPLTDDERAILALLERNGAMFAQRIGARLAGAPVYEALSRLARMGLVRQDGFGPVREMLQKPPAKKRRPAVRKPDTGRWERCREPRALTARESLDAAFRLSPVLSKETVEGIAWREALETLRVMEYTARARRGYFVKGLSGAQFVRAEDLTKVEAFLSEDDGAANCLPANDPMQAWGRLLAHEPGKEFSTLSGTAVVLVGGRPVAAFERGGECLRVFSLEEGERAVRAFADAYLTGRIFPNKTRVTVKEFPPESREWLEGAGFYREMLDMSIQR